MFVQGKCYNCGGFLAVDDTQDASICPFCQKAFVVEKAIKSFNETAPQNIGVRRTFHDYDSEFVVENNTLVRYNGFTQNEVKIPEGITAIGETAFQGMSNIESVHIPEGVELIGAGAFSGCKNLHSVHIPEGVLTIERDGFNGCTGLKSVTLPDSISKMEAGVFTGCTSLEEVNIPQNTEVLPWRIFEGCTSLKSISIPKKVKTIEDCAFAECKALEAVVFECMHSDGDPAEGVNRIGMNAFRNCKELNDIDLPETLRFIGNQAFRECSSLRRLLVPKGVKAVYPLAFADCTALEQVSFAGDTDLYKGSNPYKDDKDYATFYNCPRLLSVSYSDLQKHYWAFPAYIKSQEPVFIEKGKCRYCGGEFKGIFEKVCTVCKAPKDY